MVFTILRITLIGFQVYGPSMTPNIESGAYIMISKVAYLLGEPERGDVIGVPKENIIGKGWISYWPPPEWGFVKNITFEQALGKE